MSLAQETPLEALPTEEQLKSERLNMDAHRLRNGQKHHLNHVLWLDALPKEKRGEGEVFLVNVGQTIELAKGADIRGRSHEGIALLRSTLRKIERFFGSPVNVVYQDTLAVLRRLLESQALQVGEEKADEVKSEWIQVSKQLLEIQKGIASP